MAHKEAQQELRSCCRLYGPPGMWDLVVQEQAAARTRQRKVLEEAAEARDKLFWMLSVAAAVVFFIVGSSLMIWGLNEAVNG